MAIKEWSKLTCACGSLEFLASHELYWKEGQGTTVKQHGFVCAKCQKASSISSLIGAVKERDIQKKIDELKAEQANG